MSDIRDMSDLRVELIILIYVWQFDHSVFFNIFYLIKDGMSYIVGAMMVVIIW
jgi:hypothetical protein